MCCYPWRTKMDKRKDIHLVAKDVRSNREDMDRLSSIGLGGLKYALLQLIALRTFVTQDEIELLYPHSGSDLESLYKKSMIDRSEGKHALTYFGWAILEAAHLKTSRVAA